jgi:signal transduction histidine kinase
VIKEIKKDTLVTLGIINAFILVITGLPGYWLAGKTLRPIEEMVEKQKKFTANAAHELKTPLTAIKTNLEVNLRDKKLNLKNAKKIMEDTIGDVDSLTLLTNSLIKQSKYQEYKNGEKVTFELKELAESVTKKLEPKAKEKKIKIRVSGEKFEIRANKESISELLTIFVDNAIKFNKEKGSIDIKIEEKTDHAVIKISDTGFGIDEKDLPHVFDRFYKAETSRSKTQSDGFGLGLSIAKEIAEYHGGKITVKSRKGKGTEFTIKLHL